MIKLKKEQIGIFELKRYFVELQNLVVDQHYIIESLLGAGKNVASFMSASRHKFDIVHTKQAQLQSRIEKLEARLNDDSR